MRDECIELSLTCKPSFFSISYRVKLPILLTSFPMRFLVFFAVFFACTCSSAALAAVHGKKHKPHQIRTTPFGPRAEVAQLASDISQNQQIPVAWVRHQLSLARRVQGLEKMVLPPPASSPTSFSSSPSSLTTPAAETIVIFCSLFLTLSPHFHCLPLPPLKDVYPNRNRKKPSYLRHKISFLVLI
jgi:hypothetical protein